MNYSEVIVGAFEGGRSFEPGLKHILIHSDQEGRIFGNTMVKLQHHVSQAVHLTLLLHFTDSGYASIRWKKCQKPVAMHLALRI